MSNQQYGRGGPPAPRRSNLQNQKTMDGHQQLHQTYSVPLRKAQQHHHTRHNSTDISQQSLHVDVESKLKQPSPTHAVNYHQHSPIRRSQTLQDANTCQYSSGTEDTHNSLPQDGLRPLLNSTKTQYRPIKDESTITQQSNNAHQRSVTDLYTNPIKLYQHKQHAILSNHDQTLQRSKSLSVFQEPSRRVPSPTKPHEKLTRATSNQVHSRSPTYDYAINDRAASPYNRTPTEPNNPPGVPPRPTQLYSFATDLPATTRGRIHSPAENNTSMYSSITRSTASTFPYSPRCESIDADRFATDAQPVQTTTSRSRISSGDDNNAMCNNRVKSPFMYAPRCESIDADRVVSCPEFVDYQQQRTPSTMMAPTAIYGIAQGTGRNLVMEFEKLKTEVKNFYMKLHEEPKGSAQMEEMRVFLRVPNHLDKELVLRSVHEMLDPVKMIPQKKKQESSNKPHPHDLFIVDFHNFLDSTHLSKQVLNMFAQPGPPNLRFEKVDVKLNSVINEFCTRSENLLKERNCGIQSPAHVEHLLSDMSTQSKVKLIEAFQTNQLWIRWATSSFLPPISHLYMSNPPTYEVRKAVTLALIADKIKKLPQLIGPNLMREDLCPPIYSRLNSEDDCNQFDWQVAEYSSELGDFVYRACNLPSWMDESGAIELLNSSSRSKFASEAHAHALYSVYLIVIKDFSLSETDEMLFGASKKQKSPPSKYQYYVGCSSTGTIFQFCRNENGHGELAMQALMQAPTLKQFRCFQDCNLVDACLALSWLVKQPRAIFVLNSFITSPKMISLSIERKKPIHEKMVAYTNHLISKSKKLGPLNNMRYGMHRSGHHVTKTL